MKNILLLIMLSILSTLAWSRDIKFENAKLRKEQVRNVSYEIHLSFEEEKDFFEGKTILSMELNQLNRPLEIDLRPREIKSILINGLQHRNYKFQNDKIIIPADLLTKKLQIEIDYQGFFSGLGLKKFIDPKDGAVYIYSHLQPNYAPQIFPGLDQMDLKAIFKLSVTAPKKWHVIHNEKIQKQVIANDTTRTFFKPTPPISTFLFFVGAGDYAVFEDKYKDVPLRIFARKSLANFVDEEEIFSITKKGLNFYTGYFSSPYPFSKYDQIFVPDFGYSGMENPGAIVLNERYIFQGEVAETFRIKRTDLIFHELVHVWFGGLVTMKWWNDLWINEGLATYLAVMGLERAIGEKDGWLFSLAMKNLGYREDSFPKSSSALQGETPEMDSSNGVLEGILYSKGAGALQQLHHYVGEQAFRESIQHYLKKHAFSNASLEDFMTSVRALSKKDLSKWSRSWLQTTGTHEIRHNFQCSNGKISKFTIVQSPNFSGVYSPHKTVFGLYQYKNGKFRLLSKVKLEYSRNVQHFSGLVGKSCPDFVLPNMEDLDFGYFVHDQKSQQYLKQAIAELPDPLSRLLLWVNLENGLKRNDITAERFFDVALAGLKSEKNPNLLVLIPGFQEGRLSLLKEPYLAFLNHHDRKKVSRQFEKVLLKRFFQSEKGSLEQKSLFKILLLTASSKKLEKFLYKIISSNRVVNGLNLDQDLRWEIIRKLSSMGHSHSLKLIEAEKKNDKSFIGEKMSMSARGAYPDMKTKKEIWESYFSDKKIYEIPYTMLKETAEHIHNPDYPEFSRPFVHQFFKFVSTSNWFNMEGFEDLYFNELFPLYLCNEEVLQLSQQSMKEAKLLTKLAEKRWLLSQDNLRRCVLSRKMDAK